MADKYLMIGVLENSKGCVTVYGNFEDKNSADMAAVLTNRREGRGFSSVHTIVTKVSGVTDEELAAERKADSDRWGKIEKERAEYSKEFHERNPDFHNGFIKQINSN